ncbi:CCA tRNA nucleotidyltransferase [Candidatus Soleaferrea massiliensis]|uniref:CCA tRNA nucleotidyltransferase n=1 Tax=Candidatus Soleaferrea massiliensis TaxID=1470354 RepID=UPI00058DA644|nr:HD domain-containing protein [Candidatus Soleaferrea massiliensis]
MSIDLPEEVRTALGCLRGNHHQAYVVGGCVRDLLLGRTPGDWDITTSAQPHEMKRCFADYPVSETGLRHGTLTVVIGSMPLEITTFRIDGSYTDHRRPDSVRFTASLREDLGRRDFTVNAMAYSEETGLQDFFGGTEDLKRGILRCVGEPRLRLSEDALRILRAVRFASVLGFRLHPETETAVHHLKKLLAGIAPERISKELDKLLLGDDAPQVIEAYADVLSVFLPELRTLAGLEQHHPYHDLDALVHTAKSVGAAPKDRVIRLVMLFHDIAKPACYTVDDQGTGHFYNHAALGAEMAASILKRLRYDRKTSDRVVRLVRYHDVRIPCDTRAVRRWLNRLREEDFRALLAVRRADILAQAPSCQRERLAALSKLELLLQEVLERQLCFSLQDLSIGGGELIDAGMKPGPEIGKVLQGLLALVLAEQLPNEPAALLAAAKEMSKKE